MTEAVNEGTPRTIGSMIESYKTQRNAAAVSVLGEIGKFIEGEKL